MFRKLPLLLLGDEAKMMVPMVGWTEVTHMLETWRIRVKAPITDTVNIESRWNRST